MAGLKLSVDKDDFQSFANEELDNFDQLSQVQHFVVQLGTVEDIPAYGGILFGHHGEDVMMKTYLAQISVHSKIRNRISKICYTTKRFDEGRACWDTYHDYCMLPPPSTDLCVELYHVSRKTSVNQVEKHLFGQGDKADAAHGLIGILHIPLGDLSGEMKTFAFDNDPKKPRRNDKNPLFGINLRQVFAGMYIYLCLSLGLGG